jgi:dCMP deaminase
MSRGTEWWDLWFLNMARYVSTASKDPSTRTGAVIVDENRRVISVGYNGFAKGVEDTEQRLNDRAYKYEMVVHCETNAVLFADRDRLQGSTLYTWPFMSCSVCAAKMIQAGVKRVVTKETEHVDTTHANDPNRWEFKFELARQQFTEAGVTMQFYPKELFYVQE